MAKYNDKRRAGPSKVAPFIEGETATERHARRATAAESSIKEFRKALLEIGWSLSIVNYGTHWIMTKHGAKNKVEWWPNTAKLVINQNWRNGIHVHDTEQVLHIIKNNKKIKS